MKPGYLALYSHKYRAEKFVNYFCINLKPRRTFVSSFHCTVHCKIIRIVKLRFSNVMLWMCLYGHTMLQGIQIGSTNTGFRYFNNRKSPKINTNVCTCHALPNPFVRSDFLEILFLSGIQHMAAKSLSKCNFFRQCFVEKKKKTLPTMTMTKARWEFNLAGNSKFV